MITAVKGEKMNNCFISSSAKKLMLLASSIGTVWCLSACGHRIYTPQGYDLSRDLVSISTDEQTTRSVYLDRNSINFDQKNLNWRHATVITTYSNTDNSQAKLFGASATTEVTFDCANQMLRFDFIRTYPEPMAQNIALGTFTYDSDFVQIEPDDEEGMALLNVACPKPAPEGTNPQNNP